jgi:hypothetical protein
MSEPIKAGDLVQVVRHPCCGAYLGRVFVVGIKSKETDAYCSACRADLPWGYWVQRGSTKEGYDVTWLKRIPPLDELEGTKRKEKLLEPA